MKSHDAASRDEQVPNVPFQEHGRHIQHEARRLADAVQTASDDVERYLIDQVKRRPYRTLGLAAGIGYVLGGGLQSRLTAIALGTAARLGMALAARELSVRLSPNSASRATQDS